LYPKRFDVAWRGCGNGETFAREKLAQQTIDEFVQSKGISLSVVREMTRKTCPRIAHGWKHEGKIRRVIQGDAVEWLTSGPVRNGSKSLQAKEKISSVWDHSISILALYAKGYGIKKIAKGFRVAPRCGAFGLKRKRNQYERPEKLRRQKSKTARNFFGTSSTVRANDVERRAAFKKANDESDLVGHEAAASKQRRYFFCGRMYG